MGRKERNWEVNAEMHITARGNRRDKIFKDENDYKLYLLQIVEGIKYFENKFEIESYCLMPNHIHLQIQTKDIPISQFIQRINGIYAHKFNERYKLDGHLFEGRFKSKVVDTPQYTMVASKYIHLNPVKAGMVKKPEDYKWSSYRMFVGIEEERLILSQYVLKHFGDEDIRREAYKKFCGEFCGA